MLKLKTKECKKINANAVGADATFHPLFEENTPNKKSSKARSNLTSNLQPLTSKTGITLIALIITIIVMLILVAVTVNVALNGGLFNKAKQATTKTQEAVEEEQKLAEGKIQVDGKWYNSMQDYLDGRELIIGNWKLNDDGNTVTDGKVTLKIGDYVNYTPDEDTYSKEKLTEDYTGNTDSSYNDSDLKTNTDLKWRVLGVDANGCLTLISDKPTTESVYFKGAKGYNNGVYILNDVCEKLYSNTELGIRARSLNIEDVEGGFSKEALTKKSAQYGETKTYTSYLGYPVLYAQENGSGIGVTEDKATTDVKTNGISGSISYYNESQLISKPEKKEFMYAGAQVGEEKALTCTQTFYSLSSFSSSTPQQYLNNSIFYDMIFAPNFDFGLASRCVDCGTKASFCRFSIYRGKLGSSMCTTSNSTGAGAEYLRPTISLGSSIKVVPYDGETSDADPSQMHSLSQAN